MSPYVLDTSVVLAVLFVEKGHETAGRLAKGASMSSVNVAEVVTKCIEFAYPEDQAIEYIVDTNITIVGFDLELATLTAMLRKRSFKGVLSLGDRACIATAIRQGCTAVTADRIWSALDLGCPVELIR